MEKNKKQTLIDLVIIFLISLIPILWLSGGYIILGHDAGTPISPDSHFLDRLFTWTQRYGLGDNQTFAVPGFFLHGLEFILSFLPVSLSIQQIISFIIYFLLMGISMYLFTKVLFPKYKYLPLFAAIFYQVNHFVLQAWFVAERTKFTTYIDLPLILLYQYYFLFKKKNPLFAAVFTSVTLWILNGGGFIPLFGALLIIQPIFMIFLIFQAEKKIIFLKEYFIYIVLTFIFSVGLHSYWLLPYYSYISSSFGSELVKAGGIDGVINWVSSISLNTSFLNEFRLQGIQEWYVNPFHPYSRYYLENPFFIIISFLIPFAAFGSLVFKKEKSEQKLLLFVAIMALVSMIFMAGSHPPFGDLYILMLQKIPGFIAFRTPFYKFAPGLWLAYAILIGYTIEILFKKISISSIVLKGFIVIIIAGYTFPILSPSFFDYYEDRTTRVKVPKYVDDYAKWANSSNFSHRRLLIMPPVATKTAEHVTDWGYWSLASVHSLLDRNSYVNRGSSYLPNELKLINQLYSSFENEDPNWKNIANVLNIDGIVLYEDVLPYNEGKIISPELYKKIIAKDSSITKEQQFGKWTVYKISDKSNPFRLTSSYYHFVDKRKAIIDPIFDVPVDISNSIYLNDKSASLHKLQTGTISISNCVHCPLIDVPFPRGTTDIRVLPGSRLYSWKLQEEESERNNITDKILIISFELEHSWKRLNEIERLIVNNSTSDKKALAWELYAQQQNRLSAVLNTVQTEQFSLSNNELLALGYDTVKLQNSMILDRIKDITGDITEGGHYLESMKISNKILSKLSKSVHYTEDIVDKKMIVSIPSNGEYSIYLKNTLAQSNNTLTLSMLDKKYEALLQNSPWIKFGSTNLKSGEYPFTISIPLEVQNKFPTTQHIFTFDETNNCEKLPLGSLKPGTYSFQTQVESPQEINGTLFIINDYFENPLLPYWGNTYKMSPQGSKITETFVVENQQEFTLNLCLYEQIKNQKVTFNEIAVYQISNPIVLFVKQSTNQINSSERKITINNQSQSMYDITISPGVESILTFDQRFNSLWNISIPNSEHLLVNNYENGWSIPASQIPIQAQISFLPEKELKTGWRITLGSLAFIVTISVIFKMRKK